MSLESWQDFLNESRKRGSGRGLERALKWFLDSGPQKKGGYKGKRKSFKKKKFNDVSAPPGAPGGLEEDSDERPGYRKRIDRYTKDRNALLNIGGQANTPPFTQKMGSHVTFDRQLGEEVEEETFEMQDELQPEIWRGESLWPEVREQLLEIVEDFLEGLDVDVSIRDVRLTGSLANYNWSRYSDVDLHIVVDFSKIDEDIELVKAFFDASRLRWNGIHNIKLYGFEVELYVENVDDPHHSSGVYSVYNQKWIKHPVPGDRDIDFVTARKKSDDVATQVNLVSWMADSDNPAGVLRSIRRLKAKIRRMRRAGLMSPAAEFSPENIAFKILRRDGTLETLSRLKYDVYDRQMSLPEANNGLSRD
jgi:hypothetical protein